MGNKNNSACCPSYSQYELNEQYNDNVYAL